MVSKERHDSLEKAIDKQGDAIDNLRADVRTIGADMGNLRAEVGKLQGAGPPGDSAP